MAAELRVDTIKGRTGINTLNFAGDGLYFHKSVGIGTTITSDPIQIGNPGKIAAGIGTFRDIYANNWSVGVVTFSSKAHVGAGATFYANGNATVSGITTLGGTSHIRIPVGTTGQRPGTAQAGDFRYNTTEGEFEGYTDAWGSIGGGAKETDTAVSSTSATAVYTVAHATYRSASLLLQITQGSAYQSGRYMVIHDGTTATIVEESAVATGSMLGSFTAGIDGSNLKVYVNMGSSSSATVTVIPTPVTV